MENELISFIVPVYNCEQYIRECVESIFTCGYDNIECILIDDGSTDDSGKICDGIQNERDSVTVVHTQNYGVSNARNIGLDIAKGVYITFVDADDYVKPINFSFLNTSDGIYCLGMLHVEFKDVGIESSFIHYPVYMNSVCNKFFRRELISKNHIRFRTELFVSEDLDFVVRIIGEGASVQFAGQDYYVYRKNPESVTRKKFTEEYVKNNYQAYLSIAETCRKSQNIPLTERFLKYLRLKILIPYLTDKDFFSPKKFRMLTNRDDVWDFDFRKEWKAITWCAQKKIDFLPHLYMRIKTILKNT